MDVRAEHEDLEEFVRSIASAQDLQRVGFVSFTQWPFALAALAEVALTMSKMGSNITLAFWSHDTPMRDTGWSTHERLARLVGSEPLDQQVLDALLQAEIPGDAKARPPIRGWVASDETKVRQPLNRSGIRALMYRGSPMGRAMLQVRPDTETPITDTYFWPQRLLQAAAQSYAWVFDQTQALISERELTAIVVYNGRFLHDRAAVAAGEAAGIRVLYFDTGGTDTDFDLTDNITHDWSDLQRRMLKMYEAWPPDIRDEVGCSWFEDRINHSAPDNALFVESQTSGQGVEQPQSDVVVVYFSSSGDEIAELELDWSRFIGDQPVALQALADEVRNRPGWSLIVRSHPHKRMKPKQDVIEWLAAVESARPELHIDQHAPIDSYTLMRQADIVVTYGSTTGVEAAYAGKPVIVMGPSAYDELGCAVFAGEREELARALDTSAPGVWSGAVSYGLMMRRRGFVLHEVSCQEDTYVIADTLLTHPRPLAKHLSHALHRIRRWRLERR